MADTLRRANDTEIYKLIERVEKLETEVRELRVDFNGHERTEHIKLELLQTELSAIRVILEQLLKDVKEPIDAYKTAKAGYTFVKFLSEAARWLGPIIAALWIGGYFK